MPSTVRLIPLTALLGFVFILALSKVRAEVVTIDVTVKAIDAKERSITVTKTSKSKSKDIELEVGKKAKILIGGKDAALDSIKPGQKVSVSYETELEVVTKIEVGEGGDAPKPESSGVKKAGCRVVWTISEAGDSILTVSRPAESREAAKESLVRHDDGTVEFQHDFDTEESVDRALMGSAENVGFEKSRKTLALTPKNGAEAKFSYAKLAQLPVTLDFEFDATESAGGFTLVAMINRRDKNVEFPVLNLASKDNFKTSIVLSCGWVSGRDTKGAAQFDTRLAEQTVELGEPKEFKFTIPRMTGDQPCIVTFGVRGDAPATMRHLMVRGRLVPTLGIALAEKNGGVIAEKVLPKGLGETVGIKPGDVFLNINGSKPKSLKEAMELLGKIRFGEESEISVKRGTKTLKMGFTAE
jgi:hypothetical protein